jgi:hypothetical protein
VLYASALQEMMLQKRHHHASAFRTGRLRPLERTHPILYILCSLTEAFVDSDTICSIATQASSITQLSRERFEHFSCLSVIRIFTAESTPSSSEVKSSPLSPCSATDARLTLRRAADAFGCYIPAVVSYLMKLFDIDVLRKLSGRSMSQQCMLKAA